MSETVSQMEAHVNGDCAGEPTCPYCSSEPLDMCEVCDGQGEIENVYYHVIERCPGCLGTGVER